MSSEIADKLKSSASCPDAENTSVAIRVSDLSKHFHIYSLPRHRLQQLVLSPLLNPFREKPIALYKVFSALRDISFEIKRGETVGIIGRNGSGKSTLLQIICGTLTPSCGQVEITGRVAALLELGSGFNPEFTGRENVYLNGAVLGLRKEEIDARFEQIIAFADIGDFIDQPVKSYSSGMSVRLAFAVAINADPEILVVDEALSVGDELFQRKCFSRIEEIRRNGATILFVSHSGSTIIELCDRVVLLDSGEMLADGVPKDIVGKYQRLLYASADRRTEVRRQIQAGDEILLSSPVQGNGGGHASEKSGSYNGGEDKESYDPGLVPVSTIRYEERGAAIMSPQILTPDGAPVNNLIRKRSYRYQYTVRFTEPASMVRFGMLIKTISGVELGGAISAVDTGRGIPYVEAGQEITMEFKFDCMLNPGIYFMNAGVSGIKDGVDTYLHRLLDVVSFRVIPQQDILATSIVDFGCEPSFKVV